MVAGVQRVEIADAIDAQYHGLTVDDEMLLPVLQRGLDSPGTAIGQL